MSRCIEECNSFVPEVQEAANNLLGSRAKVLGRLRRYPLPGVNIKVIQDALGHSDISTILNIYVDVIKETQKKEFIGIDKWFQKEA